MLIKNVKKLLFFMFVIAVLASPWIFAGGTGEKTQAAEEPKELHIRAINWLVKKAFVKEAAEEFMAKNPGYKVTIETLDLNEVDKLALMIRKKESPADLLFIDKIFRVGFFVTQNLLYSFDELGYFNINPKNKTIPSILETGKVRGKYYFIPFLYEPFGFNINKKMFADAGIAGMNDPLPVLDNWDQVLEIAKKVKGDRQYGLSMRFHSNGGDQVFFSTIKYKLGTIYKNKSKDLNLDSLYIRDFLKSWKKGYVDGIYSTKTFSDPNAGRKAYKAGQIAIIYESYSRWKEAVPNIGDKNAQPWVPPGKLTNGSTITASYYAIPVTSKAPQLALKFITGTHYTDKYQSKMMEVYGKMPSLLETYKKIQDPRFKLMARVGEHSVTPPYYRGFRQFWDESVPVLQSYLMGNTTLDSALSQLRAKYNELDMSEF